MRTASLIGGTNALAVLVFAACVGLIEWKKKASAERADTERREKQVRLEADKRMWSEEGRREAERDIAAGHLELRWYGYMVGTSDDDKQRMLLLRERFGIEVVVVGGCVVDDDTYRSRAYNARMKEEFDRLFGKGVVHEALGSAVSPRSATRR